MTTSHWFRPHSFKTPDMATDVLIIGAGYIGLSTAYWISEHRPDLKITIIDRAHTGAGASGRNAGFLTKGSATFYKTLSKDWGKEKALELLNFSRESLQLVDQHILKASPELKFERTTSLTLFQDEACLSQWKDPAFNPEDFGFEWKESDSLASSLQKKFVGAYETGQEFKINPLQLLSSLRTMLEARKIQILENFSAFELRAEGVATEINFIKAKQVVLALNGYAPQFHPAFRDLIKPFRAQMLAVELEDDIDSKALHYDSPQRVYWRKAQDKILLIGGKRVLDEAEEVGNFEKLSPAIQAGLEDYIKQVLEVRYKVIHRWSGTMGFTQHELPYITRVEAPLETFFIGGFSGHGMGFGFRSALDLAELLTGKNGQPFFAAFASARIVL
jgi:gamma-glutamylputrescine oxidase